MKGGRLLRRRQVSPDDRLDVPRPFGGEPLRRGEQRFVLGAPRGRHVLPEIRRRHHRSRGPAARAVADLHDVPQEAGRAGGVHYVRDAALEMRVAVVQDGDAQRAGVVGDGAKLVALAPAREAEAVDQLELVGAQQVHHDASGVEDHVVTEVELVDVDGDPWDGRHDRSPHRRVGDHAVALAGALARDRHDGRGQVAEQLVGLVRPHPEPPGREVGGQDIIIYMAPLLDRFRAHLDRARLFTAPGPAVLAVSGGPDSVALLALMRVVAPERGLSLVVAHADHGIQMESGKVGEMVRGLAGGFGGPVELGELHLGPAATETAARRARYAWLGEVRRRHAARYLVTGHHRDDQIEMILLRLLKGSGLAGLAGMPARGRGGLVRPLLSFTRAELADYVAQSGLAVHDDPANRDPRHLRSWARVELLPQLEARLGVRVRADLLRLGRAAARDRRAWDRALELVPELELHCAAEGCDVARAALCRYDKTLSVALLRAAARRVGLVLGMRRAAQAVALASHPSGRRLALGGGWIAEVAFDRLRLVRDAVGAPGEISLGGERGSAVFGSFRVEWAPETAPARLPRSDWTTWIAGSSWEVRAPRSGDRLVPLGGVGHRPVRRLLMEGRVPRGAGASYPRGCR